MHQAGGRFAVATGVLHVLGTTQTQHHSAALVEFIALGVAAEVIVIIQHQDFCLRPHFVLVEPGGGQAAHASTHNHQVVVLIQRGVLLRFFTAPGQRVSHFKRTLVAAAHTRKSRGVVAGG